MSMPRYRRIPASPSMKVIADSHERGVHEAVVERDVARSLPELRDVDPSLALGADDDRKLDFALPVTQDGRRLAHQHLLLDSARTSVSAAAATSSGRR